MIYKSMSYVHEDQSKKSKTYTLNLIQTEALG